MINRIEEKEVTLKRLITSITCDVCNTTYKSTDTFEIQEFHHIYITGGYGSVFGDEESIECDICQHCLKKMIDGYYKEV